VIARIEKGHVDSAAVDGYVASVRRRWVLVLVCSIVFGVLLGIVAFVMTPIYRGTTVLAPAETQKKGTESNLSSALGSMGGLAALTGLSGNDYETEEAMAVLKSQELTQGFIRDNSLMPELFPRLWDTRAGHWKAGIKKIPTLGAGFRAFDKIRKLERDSKTGLITLRIDWKDPVKAADWANQLVERLNSEMSARALAYAQASLGYLQKEFASTIDVSTRAAISHLMEDQIKQEMIAHVTKDYSLKVVDKAIPADLDNPVRPVKILYVAVGLFFGAGVGVTMAAWLDRRKPASTHAATRPG